MINSKKPPGDEITKTRFSAGRVLVVDDDESVLATTAALLEDDYLVTTASSAEIAVDVLRQESIDVLCTDYRMKGMDGLSLITRVSNDYPHIGCVLITGQRDFFGSEAKGSISYSLLLKPYTVSNLFECVQSAYRLSRIRGRLTARRQA